MRETKLVLGCHWEYHKCHRHAQRRSDPGGERYRAYLAQTLLTKKEKNIVQNLERKKNSKNVTYHSTTILKKKKKKKLGNQRICLIFYAISVVFWSSLSKRQKQRQHLFVYFLFFFLLTVDKFLNDFLPPPAERGEDDIMELLWKSGQVIPTSQMQRSISDPPPSFPGSGSREGNAPLPLPQPQPHNLFIQEDEMASWLHHPNRQGDFFSGVASAPATTHQQISVSLAPQPPSPYARYGQINYMNFSTLRGNILTGGRVEAGPPLMRESTQAFPAAGSYLTPATAIGGVSSTFAVPGRGRKDKEVAIQTFCEIAGTSSSCPETEPVQIQPLMEMETADERKRKEIEETISAIQGTEESRGSTSRKRSRVAEMHNLSEKKRSEKINERMKTLQELVPRCNKNDKASMLDDVIHYVKSLQMQVQMLSMGYGLMPPMLYDANAQWFIPNMAMNRPPFPREAYTAGPSSSYPSVQADSNPVSNQPQFPVNMNPYSQFVGLHQMQQPPPLQTQTTSQQSFSQASCSKGHEDQDNQPTG